LKFWTFLKILKFYYPPTHSIYWTPYPWYFDPPTHGILPISWLEMRRVKIPYRWGGQFSIRGVKIPWHWDSWFVLCFVERCLSFWPLCCLSFDLRILITPLVYSISSSNSIKQLIHSCQIVYIRCNFVSIRQKYIVYVTCIKET
jgi:hypothetical protein